MDEIFICILVRQMKINLILVRATFIFLIGVTFPIAVFLKLLFLKQLLENQVHCDGVEGIAGGRNDLVPTVGLEVEDLLLVLFDDTQLLDFLWGKRAAFLGDKVPT